MHDYAKGSQGVVFGQQPLLYHSIEGDEKRVLFEHFGYESAFLLLKLILDLLPDDFFLLLLRPDL